MIGNSDYYKIFILLFQQVHVWVNYSCICERKEMWQLENNSVHENVTAGNKQ